MKGKTKKILLATIIVTFILLVGTFIFKTYYPSQYSPRTTGQIGEIEHDAIINQGFVSKVDKLDNIIVSIATYEKEIDTGKMVVRVYNPNGEVIYLNNYDLEDIVDNQNLNIEFDIQNHAYGKMFTLELTFKDIDEDQPITFYGGYKERNFTTNNPNITAKGAIAIFQRGQIKGDYYSAILALALLIELLVGMFIYYKDKDIKIKHKLLNNIFMLFISGIFAFCFIDCKYDFILDRRLSYVTFPLLVVSSVILLRNIVINFYSKKPEDIFLSLAIPIGTLFCFVLIPGAIPDEPFHYNIILQMAKGNFLLKPYDVKILQPDVANYSMIKDALTDNKAIHFISYLDDLRIGGYPQILYFPATIGMIIARSLGTTLVTSFYFSSYFNFLSFIILGYLAMKYMPFGKYILLIYLLNPMNIHQCVSMSADSLINSCCILFFAYILHIKFRKEKFDTKDGVILGILSLVVLCSKQAYIPLLLLLLLIKDKIKLNNGKMNLKFWIPVISAIIIYVVYYVYSYIAAHNFTPESANLVTNLITPQHSYSKLQYLFLNPLNVIYLVLHTIATNYNFYIMSFAGYKLSWLNTIMPEVIIYLYFTLFIFTILTNKEKWDINSDDKKIIFISYILVILLIFGGMYVEWGDSRVLLVQGIQGRYFIPINLLLIMMLTKRPYLKIDNRNLIIVLTILFINLVIGFNLMNGFMA